MSLLKKLTPKTALSRSQDCLAQNWTGTNSKRADQYPENYPKYIDAGEKCYVYSYPDNRRYTDFIGALGAISLGYSNSKVTEAVYKQIAKGVSFSIPSFKEVELAEKLRVIVPAMERMRFMKNGNDAAEAAIRIARAATGKQIVLSRGYHGAGSIFTSLTPPALGVKDEFFIYKLGDDLTDLDKFGSSIACVIVEALELDMSNRWREWLKELRKITKEKEILLIMDEIITGFRVPRHTISTLWDINPDIVLLGKGIANGYPLSVVGGKKEVMNCAEYFLSSTFSGEAVSLAAALATIHEIETNKSADDLIFYGERLRNKLNALHEDIKFEGYGTRASLNLGHPTTALWGQEMANAGYLFGKAWFFHYAHLEENIETLVMPIAEAVIGKVKRGEVKYKGELPREVFKIRE